MVLRWFDNRAEITGTGVKGAVEVNERHVSLELTLGLFLRPLAGKIQGAIERQIDRALGASSVA